MRIPQLAPFLTDETHLVDAFEAEAVALGLTSSVAQWLFRSLPKPLRGAPTFRWLFSEGWQYFYGAPLHLDDGHFAMGTPQIQPVGRLVQAAFVACTYLSAEDLLSVLSRFDSATRHADAVVEMAAVFRSHGAALPRYEPEGLGSGNSRIDWLLVSSFRKHLLLEVKNRIGHLAREANRIQPGILSGASSISGEPTLDLEGLFRSTWEKFLPIESARRLQGVLVFVSVKIPETAFRAFFRDVLSKRLHFASLTVDGSSSFTLASSAAAMEDVSRTLRYSRSRHSVY